MGLEGIDLTDLDAFAGGFPHDVFTVLRREAPVWWHEPTSHTPDGVGFWVVSRHAEMLSIGSDAVTFSSAGAPDAAGGGTLIEDLPYGFAAGVLLNMMDDPRHHRIRRLVTPAVAPRALSLLEPELRTRTAAILDAVVPRGRCDFLVDVAVELPLQAIAMLMGIPDEDRHDLMAWTNATLTYDDRELGSRSTSSEQAAAAMAAYGTALIERKRAEGGDDVVATMALATIEDDEGRPEPLSDLELLMFFNLLMAAGSETTRNAIALGMAALIEHPAQWDLLRHDPSVWSTAVEEILRWSSPTLYNRRTATRDVEVAGETDPGRRQGHAVVGVGQPGRDGLRRAVPLRPAPQSEPPPGLRSPQPLLPGGEPGPPRDPHHARGAAGALSPALARWTDRTVPHQQARRGQAHVRDLRMRCKMRWRKMSAGRWAGGAPVKGDDMGQDSGTVVERYLDRLVAHDWDSDGGVPGRGRRACGALRGHLHPERRLCGLPLRS